MQYNKFIEHGYALINTLRKNVLGNSVFLLLNLPLFFYLEFVETDHVLLNAMIIFLLSLNLISSFSIVLRYLKHEKSLLHCIKSYYEFNAKQGFSLNLLLSLLFGILYLDMMFFKTLNLQFLVNLFGGLLIFLFVFAILFAYLISFISTTIKNTIGLGLIYFRNLSLASIISGMVFYIFVFVFVYISILPIFIMFGLTAQIYIWFSSKQTIQIIEEIKNHDHLY